MRATTTREEYVTDRKPDTIDANDTPYLREIRDRRDMASREQLLHRVRAEFAELRCLRLTRAQAQRLFGLRVDICDRILAALVAEHTIQLGVDDRYGRPDGAPPNARTARNAE
jgi:hypothetical protein